MGDFGTDLVQTVMLHWRVRCVVRGAPLEVASGPDAVALVTALTASLERGYPPPGLGRAARAWGADVADPVAAQAALRCLAEIAVELVADVSRQLSPAGLDPALEELTLEAAVMAQAGARNATVPRDRRLLERHLEQAVADAVRSDGDVAVGVVELERSSRGAVQLPGRTRVPADDRALGDLVAALQGEVGAGRVYRLGPRKLAVLVAGAATAELGELVLRVTARAPRFAWGAARLGAAGPRAVASPDALVVLAEADLHVRRRDLLRARRQLAQHHRRSALAGAGSALVIVLGMLVGLSGTGGPVGSSRLAAPLGGSGGRPVRAPSSLPTPAPGESSSTTEPSPPVSTPTPGSRGAPQPPTTGAPARRASPGPPPAPSSTAPPPAGASSPVAALVDQVLSTAKGLVADLTGAQLDGSGGRGPGSVLAPVLPAAASYSSTPSWARRCCSLEDRPRMSPST